MFSDLIPNIEIYCSFVHYHPQPARYAHILLIMFSYLFTGLSTISTISLTHVGSKMTDNISIGNRRNSFVDQFIQISFTISFKSNHFEMLKIDRDVISLVWVKKTSFTPQSHDKASRKMDKT